MHLAAALHVLHWYIAGRTLTPVEPSEAMQTLSQGLINAGFVLFALLIVSTFIFGRFFCGWACHIVALQDLCTWLLRRVGIRPRPFRSRLLVYVPLLAAIYMFVLPTLVRLWLGQDRPELHAHFYTDDFWGRFPGWPVALLTFAVCGFLIVYLLGNKGFCTYGCPYGGVFGVADRFAPGRIRVTDACEGCGHCTATCTSNVRVHEEVRDHGMVVDPGCMKCTDCIDVCPKGALYFGFGALPPSARSATATVRPQRFDFTWREEVALAAVFVAAIAVLPALYEAVPLLLALGLAAITSFMVLTAARVFYTRDLRVWNLRLRKAGSTTIHGAAYVSVVALWIVFLTHSGAVRYFTVAGNMQYKEARIALQTVAGGDGSEASRSFLRARDLLGRADRLGLVQAPNLLARLGSIHSHLGDHTAAEAYYRRSVEVAPSFGASHLELARYALARDDSEGAIRALQRVIETKPELPGAHGMLAELLVGAGRTDKALEMLRDLVRRRPDDPDFRLTYGMLLAQSGWLDQGIAEIRIVLENGPRNAAAHFSLAQVFAKQGSFREASTACSRSLEFDPNDPTRHFFCAKVAGRLGDWQTAATYLEAARTAAAFDAQILKAWAGALARIEQLEPAITSAEAVPTTDRATRYSLAFLYSAAGRDADAAAILAEFD